MLKITCGPMFAGKSTALYNDLFGIPKERRFVFKPSCDTRDPNHIVLHNGGKLSAIPLNPVDDCIITRITPETTHIFIDEIQFFNRWVVREIYDFVMRKDITVLLYGLDLDYNNRPWPLMSRLLPLADEVIKLKARCNICQEPASKTTRIDPSTSLILVGEAEAYEPRCNRHFQ